MSADLDATERALAEERHHLEVLPLDLLRFGRLLAPLHLARDQLLRVCVEGGSWPFAW